MNGGVDVALTNEDLQAIAALMDSKLEPISNRLEAVEAKQDKLSADIATLNHDIVPKVNLLVEGMKGMQEKFSRLDRLEAKQEDHGHRIWALEQSHNK